MSIQKLKTKIFAAAYWPEIVAIAFLIISSLVLYRLPLSHDVAWQIWIARQLINGSRLYVDILELNPPLWFWLEVPIEYLAQKTGINSYDALITFVVIYAGIGLAAISAMTRTEPAIERAVLLVSSIFIMLFISLFDIAQREHLTLIGFMPYVVLCARRADKVYVSAFIAVVCGLLAAIGLALKHYFIVAPLFLEAWLFFRLKRSWSFFRPEILVLISSALLYAFAFVKFSPEYFSNIIPMLSVAYTQFGLPFNYQISNPHFIFWGFVFLNFFLFRKYSTTLSLASAIAVTGFAISYFLQRKGWLYHSITATGFACLLIISLTNTKKFFALKLSQRMFLAIVFCTPFYFSFIIVGKYNSLSYETIDVVVEQAPRGSTVFALATNPSVNWPKAMERGYEWPSRHMSFWMFVAMTVEMHQKGKLTPELEKLLGDVVVQTVSDLKCNPPSVIFIHKDLIRNNSIDFFYKNNNFQDFFSNYKLYKNTNNFDYYFKYKNIEPSHSKNCIRI